MALIVLDDFPTETLTEILRASTEYSEEPYPWLADTYDTIADWGPKNPPEGTPCPVDSSWRSPFIQSLAEEVAAFISAAPKPPKPLCKSSFAVLRKKEYERNDDVLINKILDCDGDENEPKLQMVPCPAHMAGFFFEGYDAADFWYGTVEAQALFYGQGFPWDDDCLEDQVMALGVLDELPKEAIEKILDANEERTTDALTC